VDLPCNYQQHYRKKGKRPTAALDIMMIINQTGRRSPLLKEAAAGQLNVISTDACF
jgi:hypothetical protein